MNKLSHGYRFADPALASPNRINACFAIRAFAGVRTVCRQSREKPWRNAFGRVASHPVNARQNFFNKHEHTSHVRNAVHRRTCAAFRKQWRKSAPPIQLFASAQEHDFSGYGQTVGGASHLKKALYRYKLNPGPCGVHLDPSVFNQISG
jgi:hypothetical protein